MLFSDIKKIISNARIIGKLSKEKIKFITDHSNQVDSNTLLVINNDSNFKQYYLKEAISKNLNTILTTKYKKNISITQVIVKDIEKETSKLIKIKKPYKPKISVAITGTNGKTSTAWYLAQICKINKLPTKLTGTLGYFKNLKKIKESILTTPSNLDLYQFAYSDKKK